LVVSMCSRVFFVLPFFLSLSCASFLYYVSALDQYTVVLSTCHVNCLQNYSTMSLPTFSSAVQYTPICTRSISSGVENFFSRISVRYCLDTAANPETVIRSQYPSYKGTACSKRITQLKESPVLLLTRHPPKPSPSIIQHNMLVLSFIASVSASVSALESIHCGPLHSCITPLP